MEKGKVYLVRPDARAGKEGYIRVVDESEEDYLYPEAYFVRVDSPEAAQAALSGHT